MTNFNVSISPFYQFTSALISIYVMQNTRYGAVSAVQTREKGIESLSVSSSNCLTDCFTNRQKNQACRLAAAVMNVDKDVFTFSLNHLVWLAHRWTPVYRNGVSLVWLRSQRVRQLLQCCLLPPEFLERRQRERDGRSHRGKFSSHTFKEDSCCPGFNLRRPFRASPLP